MFFFFIACQNFNKGILLVKKAELTEASKNLLDLFIDDSHLSPSEKSIRFRESANQTFYIVDDELKENIIGDKTKLKNYYMTNYRGFRVFILMSLDSRFFSYKGENIKDKVSLSDIHINSDNNIPINYDGPHWEITIESEKVVNFNFLFCSPNKKTEEQVMNIQFRK